MHTLYLSLFPSTRTLPIFLSLYIQTHSLSLFLYTHKVSLSISLNTHSLSLSLYTQTHTLSLSLYTPSRYLSLSLSLSLSLYTLTLSTHSHSLGFPRSLYSIRSPDTPKIFFKLSGVEKVVFWATPISSVGKFLTSLRNGVKT